MRVGVWIRGRANDESLSLAQGLCLLCRFALRDDMLVAAPAPTPTRSRMPLSHRAWGGSRIWLPGGGGVGMKLGPGLRQVEGPRSVQSRFAVLMRGYLYQRPCVNTAYVKRGQTPFTKHFPVAPNNPRTCFVLVN